MNKSFKDISWITSEANYRADAAISYSTMSTYNREGFAKLDSLFDKKESPSLLFGSIVDTLLTGTEEEFNSQYIVLQLPKISDALLPIVKYLFSRYSKQYISLDLIPKDIIATVGAEYNYYANDKYANHRVKLIIEGCSEYYNKLHLQKDKTLVSVEDYKDARDCVEILMNNDATSGYFRPLPFEEGIERLYQLKFKGVYKEIPMRCMVDEVVVDHVNKIVYPIDLKTSFKPEYQFYKSFIEWNYWIQAQSYWYIIRQNMDRDEYFKDFKLADYTFIVISRNTKNPLVWVYKDTQVISDLYYGINKQIFCRNWRNILTELSEYISSRPRVPKDIKEKGANDLIYWINKE